MAEPDSLMPRKLERFGQVAYVRFPALGVDSGGAMPAIGDSEISTCWLALICFQPHSVDTGDAEDNAIPLPYITSVRAMSGINSGGASSDVDSGGVTSGIDFGNTVSTNVTSGAAGLEVYSGGATFTCCTHYGSEMSAGYAHDVVLRLCK